MTVPERAQPRKPRRLGLYGPFVALLAFALAWSAGWLWLRGETLGRLDQARTSLAASGHELSWASQAVSGFPFRLDVDLAGVHLRDASGWALAVPRLNAEASVFAPTHWVAVAPDGVTVTRKVGGQVIVKARVLRASLSGLGDYPPRLSVEGLDLTFTAAPGANPFFVTAADALHLHTRAGPGDRGAVYFELDRAAAPLSGLMGRIAAGKPVSLAADALYSHAAALAGPDWASAVRAWSAAGGALKVRRLRVAAGEALLDAHSGTLTVDDDGRLVGSLGASLRQAPRALAVMGRQGSLAPEAAGAAAEVVGARSGGAVAAVTLDFQAGRTTLGPAAIGPSPKVY
ncbi:MAG: DUF2125 domain-containing protein [Caulobacteraceae bacterium]